MRRRDFFGILGSVALPRVARAQQPQRMHRIGFLGASSAAKYADLVGALRKGLNELGYVEDKNLVIEFRWAEGNNSRLPELAAELINIDVEVLVTHGTPGTQAAKKATATVPIVMAVSGDAVATGLVSSLARPGGNITGNTFFAPELAAKRLELLRELVPQVRRVAVPVNPRNPVSQAVLRLMDRTAAALNIELQQFVLFNSSELEAIFAEMATIKMDGVAIFEDAITVANTTVIAGLAAKERLPLAGFAELAKAGGLLGYGANLPALFRHAAYFVDLIIKGAKPMELPVEQPTDFQLVINLRTARNLGIAVPTTLLARADTVIE